jgi:hypothetical protein
MRHWYINLEDTGEEHGPAQHISLPPEEAQQWLADLLQRSRANKPPWWGKPQSSIDDNTAPGTASEHEREGLMNEPSL